MECLDKHVLDCESTPVNWVEALLKIDGGPNKYTETLSRNGPHGLMQKVSFQILVKVVCMKASICLYITEIKKDIAIYILSGINISPCVGYKFKTSTGDHVNGYDLCYAAFGSNTTKMHKVFKKV